jgi:hypothetical protein
VQEPAGSLYGEPDEDFWNNPVAPVRALFVWPQPWQFEQNEPPPQIHVEEEFYQPPRPQNAWTWTKAFSDDSEFAAVVFVLDEDYWINRVAPVPLTFAPFSPFDPTLDVTTAPIAPPVDDSWLNPVFPSALTFQPFSPFDTTVELPVPPPAPPEEDFWFNPVAPRTLTFSPFYGFGTDVVELSLGIPTEDYWINWAFRPVQSTFYQSLPIGERDLIPAGFLYTVSPYLFRLHFKLDPV